ncbi:SRPBCC domain-containing protein [Nonomuraea diastatica]|uniref:SRPBCC domain-containing protein n=1 Tax=Nonomuraea diastatica TaxID=1848329 RepID=UPI001FE55E63|nr:SRPBCC domain-containing protein [Nonomuraea diastatica]
MKDVLDELAAAHRATGKGSVPAGDAYTIAVRRRYEAQIDDVWDAVTSPERLHRWLKPVTGDLRLGGKFELDGGEHGEILRCEPPRLLRVSWLYGPDADAWPGTSEVEVRLVPGPTGDTDFELIHAAVVGEPLFPAYGPGAGGVGWDLALLALARLLAGGETADHKGFRSRPKGASSSGAAPRPGDRLTWPPVANRSTSRPQSRPPPSSTHPTRPDIPAAVG